MRAKQEARDDAEIAPAATQRPKQVGILALARNHVAPIREHDVGFQKIVDREPMSAGQVSGAAAEREPGNSGR